MQNTPNTNNSKNISNVFFSLFFRSVKAFQELLYINPDFQRANEVHVRLGFMFKVIGDYDKSLKHYNLALLDQTSSCTFTPLESKFEVHVYFFPFVYNFSRVLQ